MNFYLISKKIILKTLAESIKDNNKGRNEPFSNISK